MSLEGTTALISDRYLITAEVDSGATVTAGNVVYISAAGYVPKVKATDGVRKDVIGVALTSGIAGKKITVICRGLVRVTVSGAVSAGQRITSWSNGAVAGIAAMTAPASYVQATVQTELDKTEQWIGRALTSGTDTVIYALLSCLP